MSGKVGPRGPVTARIMVVGEAPGADEERLGTPFIGPSGNLLTEMLSQAGINPDEVYYTNLCQERPPKNKLYKWFSKDGVPNHIVLEGLAELQKQIDLVKPNIILPLGGFPLKFLTGKGKWKKITKKDSGGEDEYGFVGISDYRGYLLPGTPFARGIKCIPTYHPAAVLRNYPHKHIVRADFGRALGEAGSPSIRYPRKYILIDPQGPDRDAWRTWLVSEPGTQSPLFRFPTDPGDPGREPGALTSVPSGGFLTADIEYIGSRLLCLGATRHADVAVVFKTPDLASVEFIRGILLSGIPLCFQNGMFDCSILEWFYGIECVKHMLHDTMIAMHAAYTEWPKDLGFIGSLGATQFPWWDGIDSDYWNGVKKGTRSPDECLIYNGGDVWNTHDAMESLLADELQDPQIMATYRHEMDTISPLWEMSKFGVKIDTGALETLKTTLETEITVFNGGLAQVNGGAEVNAKSGSQVATLLYEKLGVPKIGPKTKTGLWQMNDWTLALLLDASKNDTQRAAIKMVRAVRERRDLVSKFCEIELDTDGRMRCHYDPAKTVTGRLSSRKFYPTGLGTNLQNVPKDGRVRAVFIPDHGHVFGYADLKSAESLVVAHITGDPEMLRLHSAEYMTGEKDGHKYVAAYLLNKRIEDITKDERYLGKRIRHGSNYGLGWKKLMDMVNADADTTGVSITAAQAKVLINKYRDLHHELPKWWNAVLQELWSTHTIVSCLGRKRVFYDRPDATLQEAIAYNPQSTIAQTLNLGLLALARSVELRDLGFRLLLQVHDAVGFQVPEANLPQAIPLIRSLMRVDVPIARRGVEPYVIQIPVDIQVGMNWGEADEDKKLPNGTIKKAVNPNGLRVYKEAA